MPKNDESTAINELISLVKLRGPSVKDPAADLFALPSQHQPVVADMFAITKAKATRMSTAPVHAAAEVAPLPGARVPVGTQPNPMTSTPARVRSRMPALPAAVRMSAVMPSRQPTIPALSDFGSPAALQTPVEIAVEEDHIEVEAPAASQPVKKVRAVSMPGKRHLTNPPWFDDSCAVDRPVFENTSKVHVQVVRSSTKQLAKKLALPAVVMIGLGGALGGYLAINSKSSTKPLAMATIEPRVLPPGAALLGSATSHDATIATPTAPTTTGATPVVALVAVRIDSQPSGATVMLVDHGKSSFLGTTPIAASLDPSRTYEVVFTYPDALTKIEKLDPNETAKLSVKLALPTRAVVTPKAPLARTIEAPVTQAAAGKVEAVTPVGEGVLMVSSKPPCEILVDGQPTGLMTPQRAMVLPVGKHKITLVTPDKTANKTLTVEITPAKPTKIIQDLQAL